MKNPKYAALRQIRDFEPLGENLGTAGQPAENQFASIREAGFDVVINLALPTSDNAIPNEGSIVTALGMTYVHIPVSFEAPAVADFEAFSAVMEAFRSRNIFVHCAANKRVSAFLFLHRFLRCGVEHAEAHGDMLAVWSPDEVWSRFISDQLERHGHERLG